MLSLLLKILLFPFVFIWRLLVTVVKFIFFTQVLIATFFLVVLAVAAFVFFNSDHVISQKILSLLKGVIP
jgi:hypothetical protein